MTSKDLEILFSNLKGLSIYTPSEDTIRRFLDKCKIVKIGAKKPVIEQGAVDTGIYLLGKGILRLASFDGSQEVTIAFGNPGTFIMSPLGFCESKEAHFYYMACTPCTLYRMSRDDFESLVKEDSDVVLWMLGVALSQFRSFEMRAISLSVPSKERVRKAIEGFIDDELNSDTDMTGFSRRDVTLNILASYLGMSKGRFVQLRKEIQDEDRKKPDTQDF